MHQATKLICDLYFPDQPCGRYCYGVECALEKAGFTVPPPNEFKADNEAEKPVMHLVIDAKGVGFMQVSTLTRELARWTDCNEAWFTLIAPYFPEGCAVTTTSIPVQKMHWCNHNLVGFALADDALKALAEISVTEIKKVIKAFYDLQFAFDEYKHTSVRINPIFFKNEDHIMPKKDLKQSKIDGAIGKVFGALFDSSLNVNYSDLAKALEPLITDQIDEQLNKSDN